MTDRELLELAAKASGIKVRFVLHRDEEGGSGSFYTEPESLWWDPLADDGDALRLTVSLRIEVGHDEIGMKSFVYVRSIHNDVHHIGLSEVFDDESERGYRTRRAIVRAAAEIGRSMQ